LDGTDDLSNLAWSCLFCNNIKLVSISALDPATGQTFPLFHPRQNIWEEHIEWNEDTTQMIGKTNIGRATIVRLQLNRIGLVNYRRVLAAAGEHPPR